MNKYNIEVYNDVKLNVITLVKDIIPNGVITLNILDNPIMFDLEFKSLYKNRFISSLLSTIVEEYGSGEPYEGISAEGQLLLKTIINDRFKVKWNKLYELYNREYDALSPFDISLEEDSTDDLSTTKDKTTYTDNDEIYGFNSNEKVPTDVDTGESNREYSRTNPKHREYTRKGNIGNITRQQLVEQERKVLQYQLLDVIYEDLASILCRNTYKID